MNYFWYCRLEILFGFKFCFLSYNRFPFGLQKSLPLLRQCLLNNKMTIEGVRAPPPEVLNQMQHPAIQPIPTSLQQQVQPAQRLPIPHNIQVKVNTLTKTSIFKNHFICIWLVFKDPYLCYNTDPYLYYNTDPYYNLFYKFFSFNDALNTFYLRLYGVSHMVKDHSDSERGNPLPPHGLLIPISSNGSFICIILQTGSYIPWPLLHQLWSTGWNEKFLIFILQFINFLFTDEGWSSVSPLIPSHTDPTRQQVSVSPQQSAGCSATSAQQAEPGWLHTVHYQCTTGSRGICQSGGQSRVRTQTQVWISQVSGHVLALRFLYEICRCTFWN